MPARSSLWTCVAAAAFLAAGCASDQTSHDSSRNEKGTRGYPGENTGQQAESPREALNSRSTMSSVKEAKERTWVDTKWREVSEDTYKAKYYLYPPWKEGELWAATLYHAEPGDDGEAIVAWEVLLDGPVIGEAQQVGKYIYYGRDGDYRQVGHKDAEGARHGDIVEYYSSSGYSIKQYRHGVQHGTTSFYHGSGQLKLQLEYNNGEIADCICRTYSEDGELVGELPYVGGRLHGTEKEYEDGILVSTVQFREGERHGKSRHYDSSGELVHETHYVGGVKHGTQRSWEAGKLTSEDEFRDGNRHGFSRLWGNSGLSMESEYSNGEQLSLREFDSNGELILEELWNSQGTFISRKWSVQSGIFYVETIEETEYGSARVTKTLEDAKLVSKTTRSEDGKWEQIEDYDASGEVSDREEYFEGDPIGLHIRTIDFGDKSIEYRQFGEPGGASKDLKLEWR